LRVIADLHIHSKYSIATSRDTDLEHLADGARLKGLGLLSTGDFAHPRWLAELKSKLKPGPGEGLYSYHGMTWILGDEVSAVYKQGGRTRKVHHLLFAPDLEAVEQVNDVLSKFGKLSSDGRPVLTGIDSAELVERTSEVSRKIVVIPAHAWTPWFGIFGSKSGFDSLQECFKDQAKKIFAIETGLSCYDEATEVLTEAGWKKLAEVTREDRVCTLNLGSGDIEFQEPTHITVSSYSGKMYRLKMKRIDLLVTPNHKLVVTQFATRGTRPYRLKEAASVFGKSKTFRKDGHWVGEDPRHFELPAVKASHGNRFYSGERLVPPLKLPIRPWMEFFGLWIAEGHTTMGSCGNYNVVLSNNDRDLASRMVALFRELGYNPLLLEPHHGVFQIRVRNFQLYSYLRRFGQSHEKYVPAEIKRFSKGLLEIFLSGYLKGDGHIYGRTGKGLSATTTSCRLRDDLQEIALKVGMSAYHKLGTKRGTPLKSLHRGKYKSTHDTWVVYFLHHNRPGATPSIMNKKANKEEWVDFEGPVYCVSVPNHVIYVRRNGIPIWCGNSDPPMNWRLSSLDRVALVSNSDAHSPNPWRLGREASAFDLPRLTYSELFDAIREKDPHRFLYTVEVDPAYGKYHFTGHKRCSVSFSPAESIKLGNRCPKCGKPLTIGVLQRVEELADRPEGFVPPGAIPYRRLLPLYEIISFASGVRRLYSKKVIQQQDALIRTFGSELAVLLEAPADRLAEAAGREIAMAIVESREGRVGVTPGFDGVYGVPRFS